MKVRFVFLAFVLAGVLAAAAMAGALWIVTVSYGELGDALEHRKRHLHASGELVRLLQPVSRTEAEPASAPADALRSRWQEAGASNEELKLLAETLDARLQLQGIAVATAKGLDPLKGAFGSVVRAQPATAFDNRAEYEAVQARLVANVSRLMEMADVRTNRGVDAATRQLGHAIGIAIGAVALLLVLTIAIGVGLRRAMLRPIARLARDAEGLSQRDHTAVLEPATRIAEFQAIAKAFNDLKQAGENEIRARLRMAVELHDARSAAESVTRAHEALLARLRDEQNAKTGQSAAARRHVQDVVTETLDEPPAKPSGSKRRRRNPNV
jgi:methyl-accepting chemotaxis protein